MGKGRKREKSGGTKMAFSVEYLEEADMERLSIDSARKFLLALFYENRKCRFVRIENKGSLASINIVINPRTRRKCGREFEIKETVELDDLIVLLTHKRKYYKKGKSLPPDTSLLTMEHVKEYVVDDIEKIYVRRGDPYVNTEDLNLKQEYFRKKTRFLGKDEEVALESIQRLAGSRGGGMSVEYRKENEENRKYGEVVVNGSIYVYFKGESRHEMVGIDCEMVVTELGTEVGRVSLVDTERNVLYDKVVVPVGRILEYNTQYSGLREETFQKKCVCEKRCTVEALQCKRDIVAYGAMIQELSEIVGANTVFVGHSLAHDMGALKIFHTRFVDTAMIYASESDHKLKLKEIVKKYFGKEIQDDEHSSVVDACSALLALEGKVANGPTYGTSRILEIVFPGEVAVLVPGEDARDVERELGRRGVNFWLGDIPMRRHPNAFFMEICKDGGEKSILARLF
jgi:DNA polymerase III epsilon subunit-like protein